MNPSQYHPVEWFNINGVFKDIFKYDKNVHMINDNEAAYEDPDSSDTSSINKPTFKLENGQVQVLKNNTFNISCGLTISKFTLLTAIRFEGDFRGAESYVMYKLMDIEIPYIRVGCDWFKVIYKKNRYGGKNRTIKSWKKDELKEDHTKSILKLVPKYDDFCIVPDNLNYQPVHDNLYNLYCEFPHKPYEGQVSISDIPTSISVMKHIFGANADMKDQFDLGMKYMKLMYESPRQPLHVPVLVSEKRETGKTTFLDWLQMIFGNNLANVNPGNITGRFNSIYASKNIIVIDETMIEKSMGIEKIKSIVTAKTMIVDGKHVQEYEIEFFGKIVMSTNKERDFMRIDSEENRFWVRKIPVIVSRRNVRILDDLFKEIPKFLKYLLQMPPVDVTHSRFGLPHKDVYTSALSDVQDESKSGLHKDLEILISDFFSNTDHKEFKATAINIKHRWFSHDSKIPFNYVFKVLKNEMKIQVTDKTERYNPFCEHEKQTTGRPFTFKREDFLKEESMLLTDENGQQTFHSQTR